MNILLCNDDGISSEGLKALADKLSEKHNILVVAPDGNRSGFSHSLTFDKPLVLKKRFMSENYEAYSFSGTPVDCVKFATDKFSAFKPDLVLSGINNGSNIGTDVLYSGTVSAACEANALGYKSMAFSLAERNAASYLKAAEYFAEVVEKYYSLLSPAFVFNVNLPYADTVRVRGMKFTPLGVQIYTDTYLLGEDGNYTLVGEPIAHDKNEEDCDVEWIRKGFATITPVLLDRTAFSVLEKLKNGERK